MARTKEERTAPCLLSSFVRRTAYLALLSLVAAEPPPTGSPRTPPHLPAAAVPPVFREGTEVLPIDLPTALRLASASNPTIALARQRAEEAYARLEQARLAWVPDLVTGPAYLRHDGRLQDTLGNLVTTSKGSLFEGGGAALRVETSDALFGPLVARRLVQASRAASVAVEHAVQLDVALAYLELLLVHGQLGVNADILARDQELQRRAEAAERAGLTKTTADPNRARAEVQLRLQERINLIGQMRVVSARLARLLLLRPTVGLVPAEPAVVPVRLVNEECPLDDLVALGLMNRPELAESRALVAASLARWRQARLGPLFPRLEVSYFAGAFGGGINDSLNHFGARGDGIAQAVWELHNLGFGDRARARERRAQYNEATLHVVELQARVAEEVTAAAQSAQTRRETLLAAQQAVREAAEMWRKLERASFGILGPRRELDSLEALLAVQTLAQARTSYLNDVIEYNRAQFQLFAALGQPPLLALPQAEPVPVEVPVVPEPWKPGQP
jgi:outer membrane protein TolC